MPNQITYTPTHTLLESLDKISKTDDPNELHILANKIMALPLSAWIGYEVSTLSIDQEPNLRLLNQYKNNLPILIKSGEDSLWIAGINAQGGPILNQIDEDKANILLESFPFESTLTLVNADVLKDMDLTDYHSPDKTTEANLDNIDFATFEKFFNLLKINNYVLEDEVTWFLSVYLIDEQKAHYKDLIHFHNMLEYFIFCGQDIAYESYYKNQIIHLASNMNLSEKIAWFNTIDEKCILHRKNEILNNLFSDIVMAYKQSNDNSIILDFIKQHIPFLYKNSLIDLSTMIFVKESENKNQTKVAIPHPETIETIQNNEAYLPEINPSGQKLFLDDEQQSIPIGYNIFLPKPGIEIQNVMIKVYGGDQASEREEMAFKPESLYNLDYDLLDKGTVVITLNLPDLLKLDTFQLNMPEDLHNEIHACIEKFRHILKTEPEKLHPRLKELELSEKKMFLYGASFGGGMTIRHAQLYPGTFDGYISHNGPLSYGLLEKSDLLHRSKGETWLDPEQPDQMHKMVDPILIMHAQDDNNVSIKASLNFVKQLQKMHKKDLARICITSTGNPIPEGNPTPDPDKKHNKGHLVPTQKEDFSRYVNTLYDFMKKDLSALPSMTHWQTYKQDKLANQFYKDATIQQRFISEILDRNRLDDPDNPKENSYLHALLTPSEQDHVWDAHYGPLYYAMENIGNKTPDDMVNTIQQWENEGLITDEVLSNMLKYQESSFFQWFRETYDLRLPKNTSFSGLFSQNENMLSSLKTQLHSLDIQDKNEIQYLYSNLLLANPFLMQNSYHTEKQTNPSFQKNDLEAKNKLIHTLSKERKMIARVWQDSAKAALQSHRKKSLSKTGLSTQKEQLTKKYKK